MPYGITSTGFEPKTLDVLVADLSNAVRAELGANTNVDPESSALGQLIVIQAERLAELWQLGQAIYSSAFPSGASGAQLDSILSLTGTVRAASTKSKVAVTVTGTNGTTIPSGRVVSVAGVPGNKFTNPLAISIVSGGTATGEFEAVNSGPVPAPAGTLTVIETPVAGWTTITNASDPYYLGTDIDSDDRARVLREISIRSIGAANQGAIRARLLSLLGVTDAYVFTNTTDAVDANGLPPHSFEAVVDGGLDATVAAEILVAKGAGDGTHGNTTTSSNDTQGTAHVVKFSRPVDLLVYVTVNVIGKAGIVDPDLVNVIKQTVADWGDSTLRIGSPLVAQSVVPVVFEQVGPGVFDVPSVWIGTAASPTLSNTIYPTNRQKVRLDTSRIVVNLTLV